MVWKNSCAPLGIHVIADIICMHGTASLTSSSRCTLAPMSPPCGDTLPGRSGTPIPCIILACQNYTHKMITPDCCQWYAQFTWGLPQVRTYNLPSTHYNKRCTKQELISWRCGLLTCSWQRGASLQGNEL